MIKNIYYKYREIINYVFIGALTTLISLLSYYLLTTLLLNPNNAFELQLANVISWILSVTFAYITNRKFVFESDNKKLTEIFKFFSSRLSTLLLEMFLMFLLVTLIGFNDKISKILVQVVILVTNYLLSKFFVFKRTRKNH